MSIQEIQKEIANLLEKLSSESAILEKGTLFLDKARESSEQVLYLAQEVMDSFKEIEKTFSSMEKRIEAVDFSTYFTELKGIAKQLTSHVAEVSERITSASQDINLTGLEVKALKANIERDNARVQQQFTSLEETTRLAADKMEVSNEQAKALQTAWADSQLPQGLTLVREELKKTSEGIQAQLVLLQGLIQQFSKQFEEIGFHQKFKDIEHTTVKFAVEQDYVRKSVDSMLAQQTNILQVLAQQNEKAEALKNEFKSEISLINSKVQEKLKVITIISGGTILGIGVILYLTLR